MKGLIARAAAVVCGAAALTGGGCHWYQDLVDLRHALRGIPDVVVVNVRNTTTWQDESNDALLHWVRGWPAAHLADWYGHSTASMLSDGTHPWPRGCTIYAHVIASTLRSA